MPTCIYTCKHLHILNKHTYINGYTYIYTFIHLHIYMGQHKYLDLDIKRSTPIIVVVSCLMDDNVMNITGSSADWFRITRLHTRSWAEWQPRFKEWRKKIQSCWPWYSLKSLLAFFLLFSMSGKLTKQSTFGVNVKKRYYNKTP